MTNALAKVVEERFVAGDPGVPATPGTPGVPAYTSYVTEVVCSFRPVSGPVESGLYGAPELMHEVTIIEVDGVPVDIGPTWAYFCAPEKIATFHPAIPPTPPTPGIPPSPSYTYEFYELGWNAGARSIASLEASGYFTFTAPLAATGIVVGFNGEDSDVGYENIEHAFRFSGKMARIYELGVEKLTIGTWTFGQTFMIERRGSRVRYYQGGTLVYTSTMPSTGPVFIDTSFYSAGDMIDNPVLVATSGAELSLVPITGSAAKPMEFLPLTVSATILPRSVLTLQPLTCMASDHVYAAVTMSFAPLRISARSEEAAPAYSLCTMVFSQLACGGLCLTGEIGQVAGTLKPMVMVASDHVYGDGRLTLQPFRGFASAFEGNLNASLGAVLGARAPMTADTLLVVTMNSTGTVTSVLATQIVQSADANSSVTVTDSLTLQQILHVAVPAFASMDAYVPAFGGTLVNRLATASGSVTGTGTGVATVTVTGTVTGTKGSSGTGVFTGTITLVTGNVTGLVIGTITGTVGADGTFTGTFTGTDSLGHAIYGTVTGTVVGEIYGPPSGLGDTAWVVNWDSKASTKYENYDFNSFAQIGQRYYGVKSDGVYLLEGDNDAGVPIRASLSFGKLDFGSMQKKRVPHAYMGVSSTGRMYLKVTANGQTYTYAARRADEGIRAQRVDIGKGLTATFMEFEIYNSNGADFELDSVAFSPMPLTRKI